MRLEGFVYQMSRLCSVSLYPYRLVLHKIKAYIDVDFIKHILILISDVSQFVADGVMYAELNEMLMHELAEDGYSGVEIRKTLMRTEIIIRATRLDLFPLPPVFLS